MKNKHFPRNILTNDSFSLFKLDEYQTKAGLSRAAVSHILGTGNEEGKIENEEDSSVKPSDSKSEENNDSKSSSILEKLEGEWKSKEPEYHMSFKLDGDKGYEVKVYEDDGYADITDFDSQSITINTGGNYEMIVTFVTDSSITIEYPDGSLENLLKVNLPD
jgi:hypothetical protein